MLALLLGSAAFGADEPLDPPVEQTDPRVDDLEAELARLREQLNAVQRDQMLAEAEALAASSPAAAAAPQTSPNAFNPRITAFGDALVSVGVADGALLPESGPWLRSLELDVRADVDPFAKAVAVLAVEQEPPFGEEHHGEESHDDEPADAHSAFSVVPEEVYIDLVALPAGFSARIGAFRQPFGVVNRSHPHDWPWPDTPAAIAHFFGGEGYADVGATITWRVPTPATGLSFTGGAVRGALLDPEEQTATPEWVGRAEWFHQLGRLDLGVGGSGTGLGDERVLGGDLMVRLKLSSWRSIILLVEALTDHEETGGYAALQIQPARPLYLGVRGDYIEEEPAVGAYASFYTSEFLRLRAGTTVGDELIAAHGQLTFVWGSHPVEPYWVNR